MDTKLRVLFDFQKFVNNPELKRMIEDTPMSCSAFRELSDDEANLVTAAAGKEFVDKKKTPFMDDMMY